VSRALAAPQQNNHSYSQFFVHQDFAAELGLHAAKHLQLVDFYRKNLRGKCGDLRFGGMVNTSRRRFSSPCPQSYQQGVGMKK
jgi:hypothetical protein